MQSITIKVEDAMANEIEKAMHPLYATKTEFIREAIREKIEVERKEQILRQLKKVFGKGKPKNNFSDREIREIAGKELLKEYGLD